ncbi:MAG: VWA domain-containing protein, partial [Dehalococcoidia bacterium]
RSCHRLIWLNPLMGAPEYQPLTQGMQAALPYIDDFLPVHNLNSLESLARHLSQLSPHRNLSTGRRRAKPEESDPEAEVRPPRVVNPALAALFRNPLLDQNQ